MKKLKLQSHLKIHLKDHAYQRFQERVGAMDRDDLVNWCTEQFAKGFRAHRKMSLIGLGGVWFGYEISTDGYLLLITCYGKGDHIDLPKALAWEMAQNDRINLKEMV